MSWGKGKTYPLIGDKVRLTLRARSRFDSGIWVVDYIDGSLLPPYYLVPWPGDRTPWPWQARQSIRAYLHELVALDVLDQIVVATHGN